MSKKIISSGIYSKNDKTIVSSTSDYEGIEKILESSSPVTVDNTNHVVHFKDYDNNNVFYMVLDNGVDKYVASSVLDNLINEQKSKNERPYWLYGLYDSTKNKSVPIVSVTVNSEITDTVAKVKIIQVYKLDSEDNELSYAFPIDELSSVNDFKVKTEGEEIIAKIYEKEEAKEKYEKAISKDKTAILLEKDESNPDIFKITLGNFKKDSTIITTISYVTEIIKNSDKETRFYLPKVIANKYGMNRHNTIDYELFFEAKIKMNSKIDEIKSYGYDIESTIDSNSAYVFFVSKAKNTDSFYLMIKTKKKSKVRDWVEYNEDKEKIAIMSIIPSHVIKDSFENKDKKEIEIIFLVDTSGSMHGSKIQNAKDALHLFLRSLPEKIKFNIVSFSDKYELLFTKSKKLDEKTSKEAIDFIEKLQSDGGTEIYNPLKFILDGKKDEDSQLQIIVITDGEVNDNDKITKLIKNTPNVRTFSLGIGSGASESLIRDISRAGKGICEFVADGEPFDKKVLNLLKTSLKGVMENVEFKWDGFENAKISPKEILLNYSKETNVFTLFSKKESKLIEELIDNKKTLKWTLQWYCGDMKYGYEHEIDFSEQDILYSKTIHCLGAKNIIRLLDNKDKIIKISKENNILSKYTSFLAVSKNRNYSQKVDKVPSKNDLDKIINYEKKVEKKEFFKKNVVYEQSGGNGHDVDECYEMCDDDDEEEEKSVDDILGRIQETSKILKLRSISSSPGKNTIFKKRKKSHKETDEENNNENNKDHKRYNFNKIVKLQKYDGSWEKSEELFELLKIKEEDFNSKISIDYQKENFITLIVIYVLENQYDDFSDEYELLIKKSKSLFDGKFDEKMVLLEIVIKELFN